MYLLVRAGTVMHNTEYEITECNLVDVLNLFDLDFFSFDSSDIDMDFSELEPYELAAFCAFLAMNEDEINQLIACYKENEDMSDAFDYYTNWHYFCEDDDKEYSEAVLNNYIELNGLTRKGIDTKVYDIDYLTEKFDEAFLIQKVGNSYYYASQY